MTDDVRYWDHPGQAENLPLVDAALWYSLGGHGMEADDIRTNDGEWVGVLDLTEGDATGADAWIRAQHLGGLTVAERDELAARPYVLAQGSAYGFGAILRFATDIERDAAYVRVVAARFPDDDGEVDA